jgi:hypothetical protein
MKRVVLSLALLVGVANLSGCFLVAAGAGAGAAIAYTNRGASAKIPGSVDAAFTRAVSAFNALQIAETGRSTADSGATRKLTGKLVDEEITVEISRSSTETANVEVVARKSAVEYDKTRAKEVLDRIVSGR